jgi:hypothetical protein
MLKFKIDLEFANAKDIRTNIDFLEKLYLIKLDEEKIEESKPFNLLSIEPQIQTLSQIIKGREESEMQILNDIKNQKEQEEIIEDTGRDLCECGVSFIRRNKNRHYKSKTHQIFLNFKKS